MSKTLANSSCLITLLTTLPWSNTLSDGVNGWLVSRPSPGAPTTIVGLAGSSSII